MDRRRRASGRGLPWVVLAGAVASLLQAFVFESYLTMAPGLALPTAAVVEIDGVAAPQREGGFWLTSVATDRAHLLSAVVALVDPSLALIPAGREQPFGINRAGYRQLMDHLMADSQAVAALVALRRLGYPIRWESRLVVFATSPGSPAERRLQEEDQILAVDGIPVRSAEDLTARVRAKRRGEPVRLAVLRQGRVAELDVPTTSLPGQEGPVIGVLVVPFHEVELPYPFRFSVGELTGSSAGLMFALEILDRFEQGRLSRGRRIAGTGALDVDGTVLGVSGVLQKVVAAERAGAELFLVPAVNAAEARAAARRVQVIGVVTIDDAIAALTAPEGDAAGAGAGGPIP